MSIFSSYPGDPPEPPETPCDCCGEFEDRCRCPECPECGNVGNPSCYSGHGLKYTETQIEGQARLRATMEAMAEQEAALAAYECAHVELEDWQEDPPQWEDAHRRPDYEALHSAVCAVAGDGEPITPGELGMDPWEFAHERLLRIPLRGGAVIYSTDGEQIDVELVKGIDAASAIN